MLSFLSNSTRSARILSAPPRTPCPRRTLFLRSWAPPRQPLPRSPRHTFSTKAPPDHIPSFREQVARASADKPFSENVPRPGIWRQAAFCTVGGFFVFFAAALQTHTDTADMWHEFYSVWHVNEPTTVEMYETRQRELVKRLQTQLHDLLESTKVWPAYVRRIAVHSYIYCANKWVNAPEGKRMAYILAGVNLAVFMAWRVKRWEPRMMRMFTHSPLSGRSYTLLTSVFSHESFFHFASNMIVLTSFAGAASFWFMFNAPEVEGYNLAQATAKYHMLAFYISAGLFSGLVSHVVKARIRYPRLVKQFAASPKTLPSPHAMGSVPEMRPSLGASGAIYAFVTLVALADPTSMVQLILVPIPFPISFGVGAMVALDVLGVLRGWRMFDHWAHLGGAAFGAAYYRWGPGWWNLQRTAIIDAEIESEEEWEREHDSEESSK